jgi:hypothetical protein
MPTIAPDTRDPVQFVDDALGIMPDDPRSTTIRQFVRLQSIAVGLYRISCRLGADGAALRFRREYGETFDEMLGEVVELEALNGRLTRARERLRSYTDAASAALGLDG